MISKEGTGWSVRTSPDGSPCPRPPEPTPIRLVCTPATSRRRSSASGFEYSKYKVPPGGVRMKQYPWMGLDRSKQSQPVAEKQKPPRPEQSPGPVPRLPIQESTEPPQAKPRPESTPGGTPPFSQYLHPEVLTISLTRPFSDTERAPKEDEDLDAVACRECVIMICDCRFWCERNMDTDTLPQTPILLHISLCHHMPIC
ncbi:hypothetical protein M404DRAFT_615549 [Pisolithus tinctorius Marx 270]|uniref:Uncharacterized protein n=1 Tax=Pisolithus tinctorius Marx 270 TaxID=870435 RepID=A0A0C3NS87_PISTI|nr:hypothetical protein M404DRAFT_615549 [Pisolithus tinctorius Marx 270]